VTVVFTNDSVPAASRPEYWRHVLSRAFAPLEPLGVLPDQLVFGTVGPVSVGTIARAGHGGARRTMNHIRRSDPELCEIDVLARGHRVIQQSGREVALRPGDLTLVDLSRPATWVSSDARYVAAVFPRSLLPLRDGDLTQLTAAWIPGDSGAGALISSLARQLPEHLDGRNGNGGARLGGAVLDLLIVALADRLDRSSQLPAETQRRALLQRTYALIEERLGDPELSPATIAAAQFISLRFLHKLFETQETTVSEWIRRRRLARCACDLIDPALAGEPVGEIGARWGITNPSHFSRLFRARYGLPPSDYRSAGGRPDPPHSQTLSPVFRAPGSSPQAPIGGTVHARSSDRALSN
jgi:AraC-like DNA-binding protein